MLCHINLPHFTQNLTVCFPVSRYKCRVLLTVSHIVIKILIRAYEYLSR